MENSHRGIAQILLDYGADPLLPESGTLRTPVFLAIKQNNTDLLEVLVENLSKDQVTEAVNQADRSGITPLSLCRERYVCTTTQLRVLADICNTNPGRICMLSFASLFKGKAELFVRPASSYVLLIPFMKRRQEEHLEALAWIMQHGAKYEQG